MTTTTMMKQLPLFQLERLVELRKDPLDEVTERRREALATLTTSTTTTLECSRSSSSSIVASAFKKVGETAILAIVLETNSILLRHWNSDGSEPKLKEVMWFRSGQLGIRGICFDPSATWLLTVTSDGRLFVMAALAMIDPQACFDCTWPTDDLVSISEDLELEGRPSALCWWETLDNKKIAIVGTDHHELLFFDLLHRRLLLRLLLLGHDPVVADLAVVVNDSLSQSTLVITHGARRGSRDDVDARLRPGFSQQHPLQQQREQQPHPVSSPPQSCLVLEKRMEHNVTSFPQLDVDLGEEYVFELK